LFTQRIGVAADSSKRIAKLIEQLDDNKFATRNSASKDLAAPGSEAEVHLRRMVDQPISA
jgi:hypothetical protein